MDVIELQNDILVLIHCYNTEYLNGFWTVGQIINKENN